MMPSVMAYRMEKRRKRNIEIYLTFGSTLKSLKLHRKRETGISHIEVLLELEISFTFGVYMMEEKKLLIAILYNGSCWQWAKFNDSLM